MSKKRKFQMPGSMVLLFFVLIFVAVLTWIVPISVVTKDPDTGERIVHYNASFDADGNVVEGTGTNPAGLWDISWLPSTDLPKVPM